MPSNHFRGSGCCDCGIIASISKRSLTTIEFIDKSNIVHGNFYDYTKVNYTVNSCKVLISCPKHGDFYQTPMDHLAGKGCPACADNLKGWTKTDFKNLCIKNNKGLGTLYVIRCFNGSESFYKIGITSRTTKLRYRNKSEMPYSYEIIHELIFDADTIYDLEHDIFRNLVDYKYEPLISFGGQTECFSRIDYLESYFEYLSELQ